MSVQFGRWNFDGNAVEQIYLDKVRAIVAPYAPDESSLHIGSGIGMGYCAFHTTKESRKENQPHTCPLGVVITWDGRLDNRADLVRDLRGDVIAGSTDIEIVVAAYRRWGTAGLARLIGDWALVIWDPRARSLILAKDFVGTRPLFYALDHQGVTWSTILDPLVLLGGKTTALCEEYIAGWVSSFPAAHLTPYVGIQSVPPSSFALVGPNRFSVKQYWDFDAGRTIRYRNDAQYEEQFRMVFADSLRRRLRSDSPVLAELSGGMDSSTIVCVADSILERGSESSPRLDTVSYFIDGEPNWDERPFFTKVEERRGRTGCRIDVGSQDSLLPHLDSDRVASMPSACARHTEAGTRFAACMLSQGNRVVLSGIGGDEMTGGVPTPMPELADLLASFRLITLAHRLKVWALNKRRPWFHLLIEATQAFLPSVFAGSLNRPVPWLRRSFVKRNWRAITGYETRLKLFGSAPHVQLCLSTLAGLRRQFGCTPIPSDPPYERRYPYLDRDLLEFLFAIPREQLVRPGQRRSLMRRALVGIVPVEVLNRKRKAFVSRTPLRAISGHQSRLEDLCQPMIAAELGLVEPKILGETLESARNGREVPIISLMRTLALEVWLRDLDGRDMLARRTPSTINGVVTWSSNQTRRG